MTPEQHVRWSRPAQTRDPHESAFPDPGFRLTTTNTPRPVRPPGLTGEQVAAFLAEHPNFLADHPALYRTLMPPKRVHGEIFADHMAAMLRAEREHSNAMSDRADGVLAAGRAAAGLTGRVQEAVLALLRAPDPADCIAQEFPPLLGIDAASLCAEGDPIPGARGLPRGTIERLLDRRTVAFRASGEDGRLLHGEAAALGRTDALVRIPGEGPPAMLALVARDEAALDPSQGTGALTFLGRAIAAALGR